MIHSIVLFWDHLPKEFSALCVSTLVDIILGVGKAITDGKLNSDIGLKGLVKHAIILFIPFLILPTVIAYHGYPMWVSMVYMLIFFVLTSVAENLRDLGLPVPPQLVKVLDDEKRKDLENDGKQ